VHELLPGANIALSLAKLRRRPSSLAHRNRYRYRNRYRSRNRINRWTLHKDFDPDFDTDFDADLFLGDYDNDNDNEAMVSRYAPCANRLPQPIGREVLSHD